MYVRACFTFRYLDIIVSTIRYYCYIFRYYCYYIYNLIFNIFIYQATSSVAERSLCTSPTVEKDQLSTTSQKDEEPVSAIFSLQDDTKESVKEETTSVILEEVILDDDDEDSIEEFDPEDPDLQEQEEQVEEGQKKESPAVYKYDMALKSYVRVEEIIEEVISTTEIPTEIASTETVTTETVSTEVVPTQVVPTQTTQIPTQVVPTRTDDEGESSKEGGQPNILKKRLLVPSRTSLEGESGSSGGENSPKVPKLDLDNPLSVKKASEEDGVMYVTVKGAKPNEILLVKVSLLDT